MPELIVGLDFAFSMPEWFIANQEVSSAPDLWSLVEDRSEIWLKDCLFPFWGRRRKKEA